MYLGAIDQLNSILVNDSSDWLLEHRVDKGNGIGLLPKRRAAPAKKLGYPTRYRLWHFDTRYSTHHTWDPIAGIKPSIGVRVRIISNEALPLSEPFELDHRSDLQGGDSPAEIFQSGLGHAHRTMEEQRALPMNSIFIPSNKLLQLWADGLNSYLKEGLEDLVHDDLFVVKHDHVTLCEEFDRRLKDVIVKQALMKSYAQEISYLSIDGRFTNAFMTSIYEKFIIRLDSGETFFSLLMLELKRWLGQGNIISGTWGSLLMDGGGDFSVVTVKPEKRRIRGFQKAELE